MDHTTELAALERHLRREGHVAAARALHEIRRDVALLGRPPSWFARCGARLATRLRPQWERFVRELGETGDAAVLLARAASGGPGVLDAAERARLRTQVGDLLKTVPSAALFVGLFFVPVPGAQALTPLFLARLGLLPSAWRESYALHALDELVARLDGADPALAAVAARLRALRGTIEQEAGERQALGALLAADPDHVLLFDDDFDGRLDPTELAGAHDALRAVRRAAAERAAEPVWYAFVGAEVLGPHRLADLDAPLCRAAALVRCGREGPWAPLAAVLGAEELQEGGPAAAALEPDGAGAAS